ncbi:hypothetical protein GCM10012288_04100 [Malaciobacter pacificus]|uniref:RND family efflux system, outer membrane channel protein, TolC family n=1 Tax=Malaciobacter pacificus TaxID=1080223 RepID=A0A5C2H6G7_9BACT|nr:TolC family protein [Malaciobacter pacificus]QEP33788.1 RND family efflux system, outer membrane channel protein, TolC family [Malaciobacter pacificus]GGD33353.1 hypothetical protein GCM10012288_04100 [Malaciobacter pacificus]
MRVFRFIVFIFFIVDFSIASEYEIDIYLDNEVSFYSQAIKKETKTLLDLDDNITYKFNSCEKQDCANLIKINKDSIFVFKSQNSFKSTKNHVINYDKIITLYDENRVIRTTSISILELLKENIKKKSIYLKSDYINNDEEKIDKNLKKYSLLDIYNLIDKNNLTLKQNINELTFSKLNKDEAVSLYKPKVELFADVIQIDADRAKYSSGLYSEGTVDYGLKVTQLIYSNQVIKNIEIKKYLDKSVKNRVKNEKNEVIYKSILTYLNILKLKKYNDIINVKKDFITKNLQLSNQRVQIGVQNRSDIYRWKNELASVNIELANSLKQLENLKLNLSNMILLDEKYDLENYGLYSSIFKINDNTAIKYINNEKIQDYFFENMIFKHPSLKYIDELINAKNEQYDMNKQSRYLPTVSLQAQGKKIEDRYGSASNFPRPWDNNELQVVLNLNLPLYEGGKKSLDIQRSEVELLNLKLKYNEVKNLIKTNLLQNYDSIKKSYSKIKYSQESQSFSKKNYALVLDRYKKGKENIISVLDAQNSYIVSRLNKNISIIDYLADLTSIYYFTGNIDVLIDKNKKIELEKEILRIVNEN